MPQTHAQIWGTLKRYLAYTAAGFVVLGGVGAMEAVRPPLVTTASASQSLHGSVSPQALLATIASDAPSWTQRLRFDLTSATPVIAATTLQTSDPDALLPRARYGLEQGCTGRRRRPADRRCRAPTREAPVGGCASRSGDNGRRHRARAAAGQCRQRSAGRARTGTDCRRDLACSARPGGAECTGRRDRLYPAKDDNDRGR